MSNEYEPNIPDSVLFDEILKRLPVKALCAYKSVCKTWLCAIESHSFRASHRLRHSGKYSDQILFSPFNSVSDPITKSSSLLPSTQNSICGDLIKTTSRPLDLMVPSELTRINWPDSKSRSRLRAWRASISAIGPIRTTGIYCIVVEFKFPIAKMSICNPTTRDYKLVNPFPLEENRARLSNCRVHMGFGLAAEGDYRVVVVMNWGERYSSFLSYVYSLKQGLWKKIVDSENGMVSGLDLGGKPCFPEISEHCRELCPQVFLNGCWHWMAMSSDETSNVLSFNMDKEAFKSLCGPPSYRGSNESSDGGLTTSWVSVLSDHLAVVYYTLNMDGKGVISVWAMKEYGVEESWSNLCTVNLQCNPMKTLVGMSYSSRENGGIHIDRILFQDCCKQLVSCDEFGEVEQQPGFDTSSCMFWNNLGISAYSETSERL